MEKDLRFINKINKNFESVVIRQKALNTQAMLRNLRQSMESKDSSSLPVSNRIEDFSCQRKSPKTEKETLKSLSPYALTHAEKSGRDFMQTQLKRLKKGFSADLHVY